MINLFLTDQSGINVLLQASITNGRVNQKEKDDEYA